MASTNTPNYTLAEGAPYNNPSTHERFSDGTPVKGLMLMQDTQLIETLAHFNRERIPDRVVHAHGVGAWGEFEVTHDVSHLTSANFLNGIGKKSKALVRISTVGPGAGSADTLRDIRGFAIKLFTEEGNQDLVFNSSPVFFVRDPIKFPSVNRSHKRHPATNMNDASMFWDFHNNNQESIHALMHLFSDRGTPKSARHIHGFSGHTYKLAREDGSFVYVKMHFMSNQGTDSLTNAEAGTTAGENPDSHAGDLTGEIEAGNFPSWDLSFQVMSPEDAEAYRWNIFDMTKVWPHADYPLVPVGRLTLNKNARNYFADIEQASFSPSTMVPGIAPSADPMLQARMFAYPDAARYRLGVNYQHLPCNRPVCPVYSPFQRDGLMNATDNYGADPNYVGSALKPTPTRAGPYGASGSSFASGGTTSTTATADKKKQEEKKKHDEWVRGVVESYTSEVTDEDFVQPREFWERVLAAQEGAQEHFVTNVVAHLGGAVPVVQKASLKMFERVNTDLAKRIEAGLSK